MIPLRWVPWIFAGGGVLFLAFMGPRAIAGAALMFLLAAGFYYYHRWLVNLNKPKDK